MRGNRSGKSRKQPKWDAWQPKWEEERSVVSANSTATTYHCTAQNAPNHTPHYIKSKTQGEPTVTCIA